MIYALLAWLTVGVHAGFILFVVLGGVAVWRRPRIALLHVPAVLWGAYTEFAGVICPLTPVENHFRALAGAQGYGEGFIEHYLLLAIYPEGLTIGIQYVLGVLALMFNGVAYLLIWRRKHPRQRIVKS